MNNNNNVEITLRLLLEERGPHGEHYNVYRFLVPEDKVEGLMAALRVAYPDLYDLEAYQPKA